MIKNLQILINMQKYDDEISEKEDIVYMITSKIITMMFLIFWLYLIG